MHILSLSMEDTTNLTPEKKMKVKEIRAALMVGFLIQLEQWGWGIKHG